MGFENFQPPHFSSTADFKGYGGLFISIVLLAFITLLFLCALFFRLVCYRERSTLEITSLIARITQQRVSIVPVAAAAASSSSSSLGLDDTTINSLPIFIHKKKSSSVSVSVCCSSDDMDDTSFRGSECSICLGMYEDEEMVKVMPQCRHSFHSDCVDEWLRNRSTCPLCRFSLHCSSTPSPSIIP